MVVVPEMIGSIVGVYNGKTYNQVEIKVTAVFSRCLSPPIHDSGVIMPPPRGGGALSGDRRPSSV